MQDRLNQLIAQAAGGDEDALKEVINHYRGAAIKKYQRNNWTFDMDDYLSAAAEGVWEGVKTLDAKRMVNINARIWLHIVVRATIGNYIRTMSTIKARINSSAMRLDAPTLLTKYGRKIDQKITVLDTLYDKQNAENAIIDGMNIQEVLSDFTAKLSRFEREVLCLQDLGYGQKDTSEVLGVNPKKIDNALTRIRRKANKLQIRELLA
jgi:RNA polymerase sporulation-specific sigma factor